MKIDISSEIIFQTARSGGKGGQNVNKVETMVEGRWLIDASTLLNIDQKSLIRNRLSNKINNEGYLIAKSQTSRSQLSNKQDVIKKMNDWVNNALIEQKKRKPSQPTKISKEKRIAAKKKHALNKLFRKKINRGDE